MPVHVVTFEDWDGVWLPFFEPADPRRPTDHGSTVTP